MREYVQGNRNEELANYDITGIEANQNIVKSSCDNICELKTFLEQCLKEFIEGESFESSELVFPNGKHVIYDAQDKNHRWYSRYFHGFCSIDANENNEITSHFSINSKKLYNIFEQIIEQSSIEKLLLNDNNYVIPLADNIYILYQKDAELDDGNGYIIYIDNDKIYVISKTIASENKYTIARNIRTLNLIKSFNQGDIHLHASGVEKDGKSFVFVGDKGTGKTTALLYLLKYLNVNFISNDHVVIDRDKNVQGLPYSMGVRNASLPFFQELQDNTSDYYLSKPLNKDKKKYFHVYDIVNYFHAEVKNNIPLEAVVSLKKSKYNYCRVIEPNDIKGVLIEDNLIDTPNEHQSYWEQYVNTNNPELQKSEIIGKTRFIEVGWDPEAEDTVDFFHNFFEGNIDLGFDFQKLEKLNENGSEIIIQTVEEMKTFHQGVKRKGGKDFYLHPISVMNIAQYFVGNDDKLLILCLLHDLVEEYNEEQFTLSDINSYIVDNFGEEMLHNVMYLTVDEERKTHDEIVKEQLKKLAESNPKIMIVKLCDRLHNLLEMEQSFSRNKILRYLESSTQIFKVCEGHVPDNLYQYVKNLVNYYRAKYE